MTRARPAWLFAVPALLALCALTLFAAYRQGAFSNRAQLHVLVPSALGINPGMPVKLNGFVVGEVEKIALLPPSVESALRVRVDLSLYRDYMRYIPTTTIARLSQEGLIGQSIIELLPQRYDARAVANGEVLAFERSKGLGEIAAQMQEELTPVLRNTRQLSAALIDPAGDFQASLKAARRVLEQLPATNAQAQRTLAQAERSLARIEQDARRSLAGAELTLGTVNKALPAMLGNLERGSAKLSQASDQINALATHTAAALPPILEDVGQAAGDGRRAVGGVTRRWPLSTLVAPPQSATLPIDSQQGLPVPPEARP